MHRAFFSISSGSSSSKRDIFYVKWQTEALDDKKISKNPKSAYWTSKIAVRNLSFTKFIKITSLWINQITIKEELANLLNLTSFWDLFFICCVCLWQQLQNRGKKTTCMADVGHQRFTKSVFYTPPLTAKFSENFHYHLFWCWLVLSCVKMLVMTKKTSNLFDFVDY